MSADPRRRCAFECDPRRPAFLHCQLLFVQVIGHGNDKKKDHNGTRHRDDLLPVTRLSRREPCRARKFCPQQHKAQQRHAYPHEIECQLHGHGVWYAFHCAGATFFRTHRHSEQSSAKDSELGLHRTLPARKLRTAAASRRGLECILHLGGCADVGAGDGAVSVGGAGGAGLLNTASSMCGLISILSVTRFCLISVPGLPWSIRKGYFKP
jgi:hypothetical protein